MSELLTRRAAEGKALVQAGRRDGIGGRVSSPQVSREMRNSAGEVLNFYINKFV
ncbi:hypothetical protein [Methylovirgula sp. 4M-Z18]|uniref:hypothetical protein n=1 Tax=Methylovirgula sp. 4M-Z18 TaxID=2293567 RepID=UPI001314AAE0|nr:hypothetical protein [Methylovirgula sp. 4M-Z18]